MALYEVVTRQGDPVVCDSDQVVIGQADPVIMIRPLWGGQSPGSVWYEFSLEAPDEHGVERRSE